MDFPLTSLPAAGEVRVDVFGPGVGESTVVHLGQGAWMVVDSCKAPGSPDAAPLRYLRELGADLTEVRVIVATHWHDDHIRGIADLYEACNNARFVFANSLRPDEFLAVTLGRPLGSKFTSGADELSRVQAIADKRGGALHPVGAGSSVHRDSSLAVSEVWALSPSAVDQQLSRDHIVHALSGYKPGSRRVMALDPNDASVVLLAESTNGALLLGGDLEHRQSRDRGWHAVVDLDTAPSTPASLFKVPHHGSENAHCPEVWDHRVVPDPLSLVTPYNRGVTPLPRPSDRERIRDHSARAYLASDKNAAVLKRDRATERTIREATRSFRVNALRLGHIQATADGVGGWTVRGSSEVVDL